MYYFTFSVGQESEAQLGRVFCKAPIEVSAGAAVSSEARLGKDPFLAHMVVSSIHFLAGSWIEASFSC